MKTAGMVLSIIGGMLGMFGGVCTGAIGAAAGDEKTGGEMMATAIIASVLAVIFGIVLKVVSKKSVGIVSSILVLVAAAAAFIAANFISAPLIGLGGILGLIGVLTDKSNQVQENS